MRTTAEAKVVSGLAKRLTAELLTQIYRHVEPAYPEEGCGFVFEGEDGELEVIPTANRATQLHEIDPEGYPRDGRNYFEPAMKPWLQALRADKTPRLIFHSHPDVGAYFSDTDRNSALIRDDDSGVLTERNPGVEHIVVSVKDGKAELAKLFRFSKRALEFVEVAAFDATGERES